jgi:prefoldin subunit 5
MSDREQPGQPEPIDEAVAPLPLNIDGVVALSDAIERRQKFLNDLDRSIERLKAELAALRNKPRLPMGHFLLLHGIEHGTRH